MSRFALFTCFALVIGDLREYSNEEIFLFVLSAVVVYTSLGFLDRPMHRWWTNTRVHKAFVAWVTRTFDLGA